MDVTRDRDPLRHTAQIKEHLDHTLQHLKEGIQQVDDPKAQALFETSAEVLQGIRTALEHFERRSEEAWRS
jgi:hypothetical protein